LINLDTHVLIDLLSGQLRPSEVRALENEPLSISDIVLWELSRLWLDGRSTLPIEDRRLQRQLGQITVWPISYQVAMALRRLDFRSDPADEIIAATSLAHGIPLLTRDQRILASRIVPFAPI
jgi:PIN domain nuclease of toxin-antitoxin system